MKKVSIEKAFVINLLLNILNVGIINYFNSIWIDNVFICKIVKSARAGKTPKLFMIFRILVITLKVRTG